MKLIKNLIFVIFLLASLALFSLNNNSIALKIPFSSLAVETQPLIICSIFFIFGILFGFSLRKTNKRDYIVKEKQLSAELKRIKTENKIYESELKIKNQIEKSEVA